MTTGFVVTGRGDLDVLFKARVSAAIANTGFLSNGGVDLAQRFETRTTTAIAATGFTKAGTDLAQLFEAFGSFAPVIHTYNTPVAGATETVPAGATTCVIELWGSGGGGTAFTGPPGRGGDAGGYSLRSVSVSGGQTFTYSISNAGAGGPAGGATAGAGSTVTSAAPSVSMFANGGNAGSGAANPGTAGGGTTNTTGAAGTVPNGGASPNGGGSQSTLGAVGNAPGGGGAGAINPGIGGNGAVGRVRFSYT